MSSEVLEGLLVVYILITGLFLARSFRLEAKQQKEIEQLSTEKAEFMTLASHEIRNPITAMRGYASLITDGTAGEASDKVKDSAQKIFVLGDEVLTLISEFLNKSKLELGKLTYTITEFDLGEAVSAVVDGYRPHTEQKGLDLIKDVDPNEHLKIKADIARVKEVVGNLIDNSLKYTPHGSITVSVHRHGVHARVVVSDTGLGIPPGIMPHLFQKFSRADAAKVNILGTGVGLYLGKTFTEAMGGRVWAESEGRDKGARFIIEFPTA
ncbi:MAG: HAMP domain-containing sensor histidine kinase [bacterium]|nr:HAMP domain-containing sensor histidine kinase [bacterium]